MGAKMIDTSKIERLDSSDGRTYRFKLDGEVYEFISVTSVLGFLLNKPALPPWAYNVGVESTVKYVRKKAQDAVDSYNPESFTARMASLDVREVKQDLKIQKKDSEAQKTKGADRGIILHKCFESRINGEALPDGWEEYANYVHQLDKFLNDYRPEFHETELTVLSMEHKYAGTLDTVCTIRGHGKNRRHENMTGKTVVLDLKTNRDGKVYPMAHFPQVDAYKIGYEEMGGIHTEGSMVVAIGEEKFQPAVNYYPKGVFLSCLQTYNMIQEGTTANPSSRK